MPRLSRAKRNQRLAIIAMALVMGIYLLVWPLVSDMFPSKSPSAPGAPGAVIPKAGLGKGK